MVVILPTHEQNPQVRVAGGQVTGATRGCSAGSKAAPSPQPKCQLGEEVPLVTSGPHSEVSASHHPSQLASGIPSWPAVPGASAAPTTLAGQVRLWWEAAEVGGGVSPGVDEVLREADVCRGSCDGNLALR